MESLELFFDEFANALWGNWLLFVLIGIGVLYTVITDFVQIKKFSYVIKVTVVNPILRKDKAIEKQGSITSFQALCTAIASCVGSGNIIGVTTAVLSGGLGAIFWMWVAAFVGMATKYGEIVLGMLYREKNKKDQYIGGPMYYISKGLKLPFLAKFTAMMMVVQIIGGNFIQSNAIAGVVKNSFSVDPLVTGSILMVIIFAIVLGGLKRLARLSQKLVPAMAAFYVLGGIAVILYNFAAIPQVFAQIFSGAFQLRAGLGGVAGFTMKEAMRYGVARGLYSNEAGEGSAPVIHSAADVGHPVEQAIYGITEVFVDTFVICTITGLVLGCSGVLSSGAPVSTLAADAFASVTPILKYVVSVSLILFSGTTLMSQWYFGFVGLNYVFGEGVADKFKYVFPLFIIVGSLSSMKLVWLIQDCALGLLTIPNLVALLILSPQVRKCSKEYWAGEPSPIRSP